MQNLLEANKNGWQIANFLNNPISILKRHVPRPRNRPISGYCYPEIGTKKPLFRKYLRENENIFEIILGCDSRA